MKSIIDYYNCNKYTDNRVFHFQGGASGLSMLSNPAYREMYMQTMQNPQTRQMMLQMMRNPAFMQQMMQTLPPGMRQSLGDNPENLERMVRERESVLCSVFLVLMTSGTIRDS